MRWKSALLFPLILLCLILSQGFAVGSDQGSLEQNQIEHRFEPDEMMVYMVCQHRATIEQVITLLETNPTVEESSKFLEKEATAGECIKLPEPIELKIEERTTLHDVPVQLPNQPLGTATLFEPVR